MPTSQRVGITPPRGGEPHKRWGTGESCCPVVVMMLREWEGEEQGWRHLFVVGHVAPSSYSVPQRWVGMLCSPSPLFMPPLLVMHPFSSSMLLPSFQYRLGSCWAVMSHIMVVDFDAAGRSTPMWGRLLCRMGVVVDLTWRG